MPFRSKQYQIDHPSACCAVHGICVLFACELLFWTPPKKGAELAHSFPVSAPRVACGVREPRVVQYLGGVGPGLDRPVAHLRCGRRRGLQGRRPSWRSRASFDVDVEVDGNPAIRLLIGKEERSAVYWSGQGRKAAVPLYGRRRRSRRGRDFDRREPPGPEWRLDQRPGRQRGGAHARCDREPGRPPGWTAFRRWSSRSRSYRTRVRTRPTPTGDVIQVGRAVLGAGRGDVEARRRCPS